jgi:hypothetical protein
MTEHLRILYAREPNPNVTEFRRVLVESRLGATRPIGDEPRLQAMLSAADLILTARLERPGSPLVGVARGVTDFVWCCYLSELAVSAQGLGRRKGSAGGGTPAAWAGCQLDLGSVPEAVGFYERVGMARMPDAFWYRREH